MILDTDPQTRRMSKLPLPARTRGLYRPADQPVRVAAIAVAPVRKRPKPAVKRKPRP